MSFVMSQTQRALAPFADAIAFLSPSRKIGRDYRDVSPVRGIVLGAGKHDLKVAVDVVPLPAEP